MVAARWNTKKRRLSLLYLWLLSLTLIGCGDEVGSVATIQVTVPGAPAQNIPVTTTTVYYEVTGTTANALSAQMAQLGPVDRNGTHEGAWTDWQVKWNYAYSGATKSCTIGSVKVDITITFTLPHWNPPDNTPPNLVTQWNNFVTALQVHENGHRDNGVRAGQEIYRGLSALPAQTNCNVLQTAATNTGNAVLDRFHQQDIQYDQTTHHGATQGAIFP